MKYIRIIKSGLLVGLLSMAIPSCSDWLNVPPADQRLEEQVYDSRDNIESALNGLYLNMASSDMYGRHMTYFTVELLAQVYNIESSVSSTTFADRWYLTQYDYTARSVKSRIDAIWLKGYNIILNINNFIKNVEELKEGILTNERRDIMLGEAYGLRAYVHLDMLRLFGPVYSKNPEVLSIPYYTKIDMEWQPLLPADSVMVLVQKDIDYAIVLLAKDPVRTVGITGNEGDNGSLSDNTVYDYYYPDHRNHSMNYYAAQTLKVRALMYEGKKAEASVLAKQLLNPDEIPAKFPWATNAQVTSSNRADRIFSKEVLFGIRNKNMYKDRETYFSAGIYSTSSVMAVAKANIDYLFSDITTSTDFRARNWAPYRDPAYLVPNKFLQSSAETSFWYFQPLIRKTELYYAIAETEPTVAESVIILNEVRANRGLKSFADASITVTTAAQLTTELTKEYMREMYGEGQLFFYYKRMNRTPIRNMSTGANLTMNDAKYTMSLPDAEKNR